MKAWKLFSDGSGIKGVVGHGIWIEGLEKWAYGYNMSGTVNTAEWDGLILALRYALELNSKENRPFVQINMDSKLVVKQINNHFANNKFRTRQKMAERLISKIEELGTKVIIKWVPREQNEFADRAARYGRKQGIEKQKLMESDFNINLENFIN